MNGVNTIVIGVNVGFSAPSDFFTFVGSFTFFCGPIWHCKRFDDRVELDVLCRDALVLGSEGETAMKACVLHTHSSSTTTKVVRNVATESLWFILIGVALFSALLPQFHDEGNEGRLIPGLTVSGQKSTWSKRDGTNEVKR